MAPCAAIVGAGPSGMFAADALLRQAPSMRVDIFERSFAPYGLVRTGVAPDHQGTKAITRQFDRVLSNERVSYFGNVTIGRDLSLGDLRQAYDLVFLAVGVSGERRLNIAGDDLEGVYGARAFVGWLNSSPDQAGFSPKLGRHVAIVGNGNVALDVARILSKDSTQLAGSDISPAAEQAIADAGIDRVTIIGRRNFDQTRFSLAELDELARLPGAGITIENAVTETASGKANNVTNFFRNLVASPGQCKKQINFLFNSEPDFIFQGDNGLCILLKSGGAATRRLEVDALVTAIGHVMPAGQLCEVDQTGTAFRNDDGRIDEGLYAVGWCRRGPSGTIPTSRKEARDVVGQALAWLEGHGPADSGSPPQSLDLRPNAYLNLENVVNYEMWLEIDRLEMARARPYRLREKFQSFDELEQLRNVSCNSVP